MFTWKLFHNFIPVKTRTWSTKIPWEKLVSCYVWLRLEVVALYLAKETVLMTFVTQLCNTRSPEEFGTQIPGNFIFPQLSFRVRFDNSELQTCGPFSRYNFTCKCSEDKMEIKAALQWKRSLKAPMKVRGEGQAMLLDFVKRTGEGNIPLRCSRLHI